MLKSPARSAVVVAVGTVALLPVGGNEPFVEA